MVKEKENGKKRVWERVNGGREGKGRKRKRKKKKMCVIREGRGGGV